MNSNEQGSARLKSLLALAIVSLLGGFAVLFAQGLRLTSVKETQPGQIAIDYESDIAGRFRLLRGASVTNITAAVATNDTPAKAGRFIVPLQPGSAASGQTESERVSFFRLEQIGAAPANQPPAVVLTAPAAESQFPAPSAIRLIASAADADGAISKVEFLAGTNRVGEVAAAPYTFLWEAALTGDYALTARATDDRGAVTTSEPVLISVISPPAFPLTTFISSPADGEGDVSVNRETILRFSNPIASDSVIGTDAFFATYGGRKLLSRIELASDNRTATLFYLETVPASARIRVTFLGDSVFDFLGRPVDGDNDGRPGGMAQIDFDTLSITPVGQTAIIGRVFASELVPDPQGTGATVNKPLAGVTITVDGAEETLRAVTDALGNFKLQPCPAGKFFVHIDGRTSPLSNYPNGDYYPFVGKQWEAFAGKMDNLAGGTGEIYLPIITTGTLQPVSATVDTTITFPPSVVASNSALAGVSISVPANTLFSDNGTRGGRVGIAPVSPDRLPGPLPSGLQFPLVITVQTDGGLNFDQPAPVCFPNLPDPGTGKPLAPGEKNYLYSFNHDKGGWEAIGSMTVSADGRMICTDHGVGITQPGWHGTAPPPIGPPPPCPSCCSGSASGGGLGRSTSREPQGSQQGPLPPLIKCLDCVREHLDCSVECMLVFLAKPICKRGLPGAAACGGLLLVCKSVCLYDFIGCIGGSAGTASLSTLNADSPPQIIEFEQLLDGARKIASENVLSDNLTESELTEFERSILGAARLIEIEREFFDNYVDRASEAIRASGLPSGGLGNAPKNPSYFVATIGDGDNPLIVRGITLPNGEFQLFAPRGASLNEVYMFDPLTKRIGIAPLSQGLKHDYEFDPVIFGEFGDQLIDQDSDGLPDIAEYVLGTNQTQSDTDSDGIPDGAELEHGTNPLDGLAVATGIIASADTPGTAVDICAINNIAIVADSEAGISVFNVLAGLNPVRIAQVDTPGSALAVTCSGNLIAVADGSEGLQIVDISDPPAAGIVRQVGVRLLGGGSAQAVTSAADLAFIGTTGGFVSMVHLPTGIILQSLDMKEPVHDLIVEGLNLHVLLTSKLILFDFSHGPLVRISDGKLTSGLKEDGLSKRRRLSTGGGVAYVSTYAGYETFDTSGRDQLASLGKLAFIGPNSFKQIVPNGSGLGLACVGVNPRDDGTHDVYLYDVSKPENTGAFLTVLQTPGIAYASSIFNGLAYVADGRSGLQVVNYLAYDNKKQSPTGTLKTSSTDENVSGGGFVVLRAEVRDDVQVRNVEFFVDGLRLAVDGNFPFETVYRVPTNAVGGKLTFSVNIFDTGGNTASVTNAPLTVIPDNQPPGISIDSPTDKQVFFIGDDVPIRVTAIDNSGIDTVTFQLNAAPVPVRRLSFYEWQIGLGELPTGTNTLVATATDLAGLTSISKPVRFVVLKEGISREISTFNFGPSEMIEAISREVSTFNFGPTEVAEAISREVSTFNLGPADRDEAISRELSVENNKPPVAASNPSGPLRAQAK